VQDFENTFNSSLSTTQALREVTPMISVGQFLDQVFIYESSNWGSCGPTCSRSRARSGFSPSYPRNASVSTCVLSVGVKQMDFHLDSMRNNEQEPSDAQLVGRV